MDDPDATFEIISDPRAMRHWSTLPHTSVDVIRGHGLRWISAYRTARISSLN
jgi:hypothetical protein